MLDVQKNDYVQKKIQTPQTIQYFQTEKNRVPEESDRSRCLDFFTEIFVKKVINNYKLPWTIGFYFGT